MSSDGAKLDTWQRRFHAERGRWPSLSEAAKALRWPRARLEAAIWRLAVKR